MAELDGYKRPVTTGPINYGNTPALPPPITRNILVNGPPAPTNPMDRQLAQSNTPSSLKGTGPAPDPAAAALSRNAGNEVSGPVSSMAKSPFQFGPALTNTADPANLAKMRPQPMSQSPLDAPASVQGSMPALGRVGEAYREGGGGLYGAGKGASALLGEVTNPLAAMTGEAVDAAGNVLSGVGSFVRGAFGAQPSAPAVVSAAPATIPPGGGVAEEQAQAAMMARTAAQPQAGTMIDAFGKPMVGGRPVPGAPGVMRSGNSYSNVPQVVAGQPQAGQPQAVVGQPQAGPVQNSIQVAPGGGYTGVGFTAGPSGGGALPGNSPASGVIGMNSRGVWEGNAQPGPVGTMVGDQGGRAAGPAALSAALSAAAARGDTDALVRHYGSFNGETEAGNRAAALTRQAMGMPPGSRQRAGIMSEVAAIHAGESGKAAGALASRKQRGEEAKIAGEVGKMSAEARKAQGEAAGEAQRLDWAQEMAGLNDQNDPGRKRMYALIDAIQGSKGGESSGTKPVIAQKTAGHDSMGRPYNMNVAIDPRTGKELGTPPKNMNFTDLQLKAHADKEFEGDMKAALQDLLVKGYSKVVVPK